MTRIDSTALRIFVYDEIIACGVPPTSDAIGQHFDVSPDDARQSLRELRIGKTILVHPGTGEIWMAGPFSASESAYRLTNGARSWWANCAWDMFGVPMLVGEPLRADTRCTDCGDPIALRCDPTLPPNDADGVVHFLLPARRWYDDIGFT